MNYSLQTIAVTPHQQTVSRCRFCQNYKPLKGKTGFCHKLNAPVVGKWKSCCLAAPPFASSWESKSTRSLKT